MQDFDNDAIDEIDKAVARPAAGTGKADGGNSAVTVRAAMATTTAIETAKVLRCSLRTLDRERADGRGCPFVRIGGCVRYRRSDIEAFIAANVRGYATGAVPVAVESRRRRLSKQAAHGGGAR
jgi:Helix-turn-helix domain